MITSLTPLPRYYDGTNITMTALTPLPANMTSLTPNYYVYNSGYNFHTKTWYSYPARQYQIYVFMYLPRTTRTPSYHPDTLAPPGHPSYLFDVPEVRNCRNSYSV